MLVESFAKVLSLKAGLYKINLNFCLISPFLTSEVILLPFFSLLGVKESNNTLLTVFKRLQTDKLYHIPI